MSAIIICAIYEIQFYSELKNIQNIIPIQN